MKYNDIATVKDLRRVYHITQNEMSHFIGVSERNYREKENGKVPFTQLEIMKLIFMFEMESDDAFRLFYKECIDSFFWKSIHLNLQHKINKNSFK